MAADRTEQGVSGASAAPDGWIKRMGDPVMATVTLTLPDGSQLHRRYLASDGTQDDWMLKPPSWLTNLRKRWDKPQDPVAFFADVAEGHDEEARLLIARSARPFRALPASAVVLFEEAKS